MEVVPAVLDATVMHKRHFPRVHGLNYRASYLALPLTRLHDPVVTRHLAVNRAALLSFREKDHAPRDGSDLHAWVRGILRDYAMDDLVDEVVLISMPRMFGYVFNPVSFWMCLDRQRQLRAVLCEVNNTFGETHSYLCAHGDRRPLGDRDRLRADKLLHVSPFLRREGHYCFRFAWRRQFGVWIDYHDAAGNKQLTTSLTGTLAPLQRPLLRRAFFGNPLVTLQVILLIHWQALRLIARGIRYIPKPRQHEDRISAVHSLRKK